VIKDYGFGRICMVSWQASHLDTEHKPTLSRPTISSVSGEILETEVAHPILYSLHPYI
jgi:hypothetical protein